MKQTELSPLGQNETRKNVEKDVQLATFDKSPAIFNVNHSNTVSKNAKFKKSKKPKPSGTSGTEKGIDIGLEVPNVVLR